MTKRNARMLDGGPWCAQCRAGGSMIEAEFYVEGIAALVNQERPMPYRGYLCTDHKTMFDMDGSKWRKVQRLSGSALALARARNECREIGIPERHAGALAGAARREAD